MDYITLAFQILVPLGIFNVWLLRSAKLTTYRGRNSRTLREEFTVYGLNARVFYVVGFLKLTSAVCILLGFLYPPLLPVGAAVMTTLMLGALAMHFKVKDEAVKSLPASLMLVMSVWLLVA